MKLRVEMPRGEALITALMALLWVSAVALMGFMFYAVIDLLFAAAEWLRVAR